MIKMRNFLLYIMFIFGTISSVSAKGLFSNSYAVSFDEKGMTVVFSPYELACYAAGPQVFHLSLDFLEPYLSDYGRALLGIEV